MVTDSYYNKAIAKMINHALNIMMKKIAENLKKLIDGKIGAPVIIETIEKEGEEILPIRLIIILPSNVGGERSRHK